MSNIDHETPEEKALREARRMVALAAREEQQMQLFEPLTAEEIFEAQADAGPLAGIVTVMKAARAKRGRVKGTPNRRNEDFVRYLSQFGRDPAITMMELQSTSPEELVARSHMLDPPKRRMSYLEAQSLRVRSAEALLPYFHSKQPVAVDHSLSADFSLLIPGLNISAEDAAQHAEGQFLLEGEWSEENDDAAQEGK